jgi:ABC-type cobalamin/Fe3+-siderophores transport system ATPase subunit
LAGTGKTTVLRHIASFKKPGEKWIYLVFNKRNQLEAKESFPKDIESMTSHGFLKDVLN